MYLMIKCFVYEPVDDVILNEEESIERSPVAVTLDQPTSE